MKTCLSLLSVLLWASINVYGQVVYNEVDDPRCHSEPNRPILEPSPTPTPFPPTVIEVYDETNPPTPTPLCPGMVSGFQIVDLEDNTAFPITVEDGTTIQLSELPESFTVEAVLDGDGGSSGATQVKFFVNGQHVHTDSEAPFYFKGDSNEFSQLYVEGTYTISALALSSDGTWETNSDECALTVTVEYANPPGVCEGLVTKFALFDTEKQQIVEGYASLADGQDLDLKYLPDHLSIVAIPNGRGGDQVVFTVDGTEFATITSPPYAISGTNVDGIVAEWPLLRESGSYTIEAKMQDRLGDIEDDVCKITIGVTSDWICVNQIEGFSLIDAETNQVIPGYEHMAGTRAIDLADLNGVNFINLRANKVDDEPKGVVFYIDGNKYRTDSWAPYSFGGDFQGNYHASTFLNDEGRYVITAVGKDADTNDYETLDKACMLDITITDTSYEQGGQIPPDTILQIIDNDDGPCAPKLVAPLTVGNHMYYDTPVKVVEVKTDDTVSFKVFNYILDKPVDWITTSFVTKTGYEVCDKTEQVDFQDSTEHVYEAKCHDGFAYADVFVHSSTFSPEQASADTTALPDACKNPFDGQVVRYTFVFSCNCEETPEIPDEIVGGIDESYMQCAGSTAIVSGDPHIRTYDVKLFDCMANGEFILSKAVLDGYPYDFEVNGRFWKFGYENFLGNWMTGIVAKQDVSVQLTIAESELSYTTMFGNVPVNFYVDGKPRLLSQGSGDHRVIVSVTGSNKVSIFFVTTGINISVTIQPGGDYNWGSYPGAFDARICIPNNNDKIIDFTGLLGNKDGDPTNDRVDPQGNAVEATFDSYDYCTTWCLRDETQSLFAFDEGYDFTHYNWCDYDRARRLSSPVDLSNVSPEIQAICGQINFDESLRENCLYDGIQAGKLQADIAVVAAREIQKARRADMLAEPQDEAACCSRDFKTCDESCGTNEYLCSECDANDTFKWLPHGKLDEDCAKKQSTCSTSDDCCPGLECNASRVCTAEASSGRRLEEFVFARPDLPTERNIITYSDLL